MNWLRIGAIQIIRSVREKATLHYCNRHRNRDDLISQRNFVPSVLKRRRQTRTELSRFGSWTQHLPETCLKTWRNNQSREWSFERNIIPVQHQMWGNKGVIWRRITWRRNERFWNCKNRECLNSSSLTKSWVENYHCGW